MNREVAAFVGHGMSNQQAQNYLRTKVFTATPEQLQLMLYDGAIRFAEQAKIALEQKNYEQSCDLICRTQKIIAEMTSSLKPKLAPELCGKLAALYNYIYRKLIEANIKHTVESLEEALAILRHQRETWTMLMTQLGKAKAALAANALDLPAPNARMEASISMQG